ncbi:MAG TPA: hypothetical protein VFB45_04720 [Pseudolabrys sp.]|nr:hypothetical protein [Pseudolabrys sp.]
MTPEELFAEFEKAFEKRKFVAGLLVAYIDFFAKLQTPSKKYQHFKAFLRDHPRQTETAAGARANTLIVRLKDESTMSLRPFYNAAERFYRAENKRFDYPSAAPHATQAWADYPKWLDSLVTYSQAELDSLKEHVNDFVLEKLKSQEFDPSSITVEPPLFQLVLKSFDITSRKGEPSGASFQGIVFGFLRADNPHLQIEIDKVRTGSKRLQRIGDVDGWEGARLAISAEVKQFTLKADHIPDLEGFANATGRRGALGVVAALDFEDEARTSIREMGLIPLTRADMLNIVELWDPIKQRTAVASLVYYVRHVEKNSSLSERIEKFVTEAGDEWTAARQNKIAETEAEPLVKADSQEVE